MYEETTMNPAAMTPRPRLKDAARAFTLIEMIVAVAILAVIISLLIVGLNRANKAANAAAGAMNVASLRTATESFVRNFGFPPPMIKDFARPTPEVYTPTNTDPVRFSVYDRVKDRDFLRRDPAPYIPAGWGAATELTGLYDIRYSNVSLPFYLAGASEKKGNESSWQVPIDGVPGPGFLEPLQDGSFAVPEDLKKAATTRSSRSIGRRFDSMVDTSKGGLQIVANGEGREFRDSRGRVYRYYLWIQGNKDGRKLTLTSLNIPQIILETMSRPEDRFKPLATANPADHRASIPELNAATWAILWPGPDGVFGDEMKADLESKLGVTLASAAEETEARKKAIADNVAEVGQ
jgi:prepilin-type N-terminal cleavage/methylation domain-containing protein